MAKLHVWERKSFDWTNVTNSCNCVINFILMQFFPFGENTNVTVTCPIK